MIRDLNTPRKDPVSEEFVAVLLSAASSKKAKNSNLKGNAFGDCSSTYRKYNYQPMMNIMPLLPQQEAPPKSQEKSLQQQYSKLEQMISLNNQEKMLKEQLRQNLLRNLIQKQAQLRNTTRQKLRKGKQLIEITRETTKIKEWFSKMEVTRGRALELRSSILQRTDDQIYKNNSLIFKRERQLKKLIEEIQAIAQREAVVEGQRLKQTAVNKQIRDQLRALNEKNTEVVWRLKEEEKKEDELRMQISILKMQLNPYLRISFECFGGGGSTTKSMILNKDPNIWEQRKTKVLPQEDIKNYIVLQLYPNWKRIINNVSFNFNGFKMLFFQNGKAQDLRLITDCGQTPAVSHQRKIKCKNRNLIVFYSTCASSYEHFKSLFIELTGQSNDVLKINQIGFHMDEGQDSEEMGISYIFKGEKRDKTFRLFKAISPFLTKEEDKTILIKLQVPLTFTQPGEKTRAEEVYKMLERYV